MNEHSLLHPVENVGRLERIASGTAGALLLSAGLAQRRAPGYALAILGGALLYRGLSGNCKAYQACGISTAESPHDRVSVPGNLGIKVEHTVMIHRTPAELFQAWRRLENLPRFLAHVRSVRPLGEGRTHWVADAPGGQTVEWDAEIINEHENEMISWRSLPGADVDNAGTVRFRAVPGGAEVRVALEYYPPAGRLGALFARMFGHDPAAQIEDDMLRFKHIMETAD